MATKSQCTTISDRSKEVIELVRLYERFCNQFDNFDCNHTPLVPLYDEVWASLNEVKKLLGALLSQSVCEDGRIDNN